uniref:N-terminal Ras-GEF domain-containing protein n=1 Tax=Panagrolaimus davidi TaxID=227884 RepID=A0A914PQ64_9BILA
MLFWGSRKTPDFNFTEIVCSRFIQIKAVIKNSVPGGPLAGRYDTVQSHGLNTTTTNDEQAFMRFRREYQKPIQTKVFLVLNHWIKHHFYDFAQDPALLQRLRQFLQGKNSRIKLRNDHLKTCKMLLDAISKQETTEKELESSAALTLIKEQASDSGIETPNGRKKTGRTVNVTNFPETLWHYAKKGDSENYDLLTLHPVEIGKQITLLHFQMYSNIKPVEIASKNLKKEKYCSPALKKWITHNNNNS